MICGASYVIGSGELSQRQERSIIITDTQGDLLSISGQGGAQFVRLGSLPSYLPLAVIATEDRRFLRHGGLDLRAILRAFVANARAGKVTQGGSTLTQQLAKNLFLSPTRSFQRKLQEAFLTLWLERTLSKGAIIERYLNSAYFGAGATGVAVAARRFFGRPVQELSLPEAALLAGLLKAPSRDNPSRAPRRAQLRARLVLRAMAKENWITAPAAAKAIAELPAIAAQARLFSPSLDSAYFTDWIREQMPSYIAPKDIARASFLKLQTTIDQKLQTIASEEIRKAIDAQAQESDVSQAAFVALASDGAVLAMVGGYDYKDSQFNRVTQAKRQPGSAFKLFVYLSALEAGYHPQDTVSNRALTLGDWKPKNFGTNEPKSLTLEEALASSANLASVRLTMKLGPRRIARLARRLGISSPLTEDGTLSLGSSEVRLLELAAAYAVVANEGRRVWPYGLRSIISSSPDIPEQTLYQRRPAPLQQLLSTQVATDMNRLLRRAVTQGTGRAANQSPLAVRGKTGTSQDYRDAWFVGSSNLGSSDLGLSNLGSLKRGITAGVWLGNDNNQPMNKITGGNLPAQIWRRIFSRYHKARP